MWVEHEERQYRLAVVNRRTKRRIVGQSEVASYPPDRHRSLRAHRLILPGASCVFRKRRTQGLQGSSGDARAKTIGET